MRKRNVRRLISLWIGSLCLQLLGICIFRTPGTTEAQVQVGIFVLCFLGPLLVWAIKGNWHEISSMPKEWWVWVNSDD